MLADRATNSYGAHSIRQVRGPPNDNSAAKIRLFPGRRPNRCSRAATWYGSASTRQPVVVNWASRPRPSRLIDAVNEGYFKETQDRATCRAVTGLNSSSICCVAFTRESMAEQVWPRLGHIGRHTSSSAAEPESRGRQDRSALSHRFIQTAHRPRSLNSLCNPAFIEAPDYRHR